MPDEVQNALLHDVLESSRASQSYLRGVSREAFLANPEKQDAVLRRFEVIGEAVGRLTPQTRELFPSIPFRSIRGTRNIIAHDEGDIDLEQVWNTPSTDLDGLVATLKSYFASSH